MAKWKTPENPVAGSPTVAGGAACSAPSTRTPGVDGLPGQGATVDPHLAVKAVEDTLEKVVLVYTKDAMRYIARGKRGKARENLRKAKAAAFAAALMSTAFPTGLTLTPRAERFFTLIYEHLYTLRGLEPEVAESAANYLDAVLSLFGKRRHSLPGLRFIWREAEGGGEE